MQGLAVPLAPSPSPRAGERGAEIRQDGKFVAALYESRAGSSFTVDSSAPDLPFLQLKIANEKSDPS
jgi:hypothetical protein